MIVRQRRQRDVPRTGTDGDGSDKRDVRGSAQTPSIVPARIPEIIPRVKHGARSGEPPPREIDRSHHAREGQNASVDPGPGNDRPLCSDFHASLCPL